MVVSTNPYGIDTLFIIPSVGITRTFMKSPIREPRSESDAQGLRAKLGARLVFRFWVYELRSWAKANV